MKPTVHTPRSFHDACLAVIDLTVYYGKLIIEYDSVSIFVRYSVGKQRYLDIFPILAPEKP